MKNKKNQAAAPAQPTHREREWSKCIAPASTIKRETVRHETVGGTVENYRRLREAGSSLADLCLYGEHYETIIRKLPEVTFSPEEIEAARQISGRKAINAQYLTFRR